jgi:dCTP deaminase
MILSYTELSAAVHEGSLVQFADVSQVNGSSIDVSLGASLLTERLPPGLRKGTAPVVGLTERESPLFEELQLSVEQPFLLTPGQFVLAVTRETFSLPSDITAEFRLKSSAARAGLGHSIAVVCHPGWAGALTLELTNVTQHHIIRLQYGDFVGQMVFHRHEPVPRERLYVGSYNGHLNATAPSSS